MQESLLSCRNLVGIHVSAVIMQAYGKTTYLITTLKIVPRGTEGAVSLEGTAAGIAAAALFGGLALGLKLVCQDALTHMLAATLGSSDCATTMHTVHKMCCM